MNIFFCDIWGTFNYEEENKEELMTRFVFQLQKMMKKDNINELEFIFISLEQTDVIYKYMSEFNSFLINNNLNGSIKINLAFGENEYIDINGEKSECISGKVAQILSYIKNKDINKLYFADDTITHHHVLINMMSKFRDINVLPENLILFIPGKKLEYYDIFPDKYEHIYNSKIKGLEGLTECLENKEQIYLKKQMINNN